MNTSRLLCVAALTIAGGLLIPVGAQSSPIAPRYHSAQNPSQPPLPFNPFPELPVSDLGGGTLVFDDTEVDYGELLLMASLMNSMNSSAPSPPGGGGGGGGAPVIYAPPTVAIPGVPLLKIETFDEGVKVVSFNTIPGRIYELQQAGDLTSQVWTTIEQFVATSTNADFTVEESGMRFYRVFQDDDIIQFPDWFDSVWQFLEFTAYTPVTDGTIEWELYGDGTFITGNSGPIPPSGTVRVYDANYDPAFWPNTGYYGIGEWEFRISVTPSGSGAAPTTHKNVRKQGRRRNPPGTYHGMVVQQTGIFSPVTQDEVDDWVFLNCGALYQPSELVNFDFSAYEPLPDKTIVPPNCNIWGTTEWNKLRNLVTGTGQNYIDYLHYLGHGNTSQIGGGANTGGGKITLVQLKNSALSSNGMTFVALDACRAADGTAFLKAWTGFGETNSYAKFVAKGWDPHFGASWNKIKGVEWVNQGLLVDEHFWFWTDFYYDLSRRNGQGLMFRRYYQAYDFAKLPAGQSPVHTLQTNPQSAGFVMVGCHECRFDERAGLQ
jgi:hypothetical protein